MASRIQKSHKGVVSVLSQKGVLRLRWRLEGVEKRPVLYLGLPDTRSNRKKAELLAKQIEIDLAEGTYDPTMERYRAQVRPMDVDAQVRAQGESVVDFFHRFMDYKAKEVDTRTLEKWFFRNCRGRPLLLAWSPRPCRPWDDGDADSRGG
jgi:integrase